LPLPDAGFDGETRYLSKIDSAPATVERVIKKLASKYEKVRVCYEAAGLCPRNDESAGKRRSTRLRKGAAWLKTLLVQCAQGRKKDCYFNAQFLRIRGRRVSKKATCAVAASLLTTIYHMLKDGTQFQDLGADHFNRRSKEERAQLTARTCGITFLSDDRSKFDTARWSSVTLCATSSRASRSSRFFRTISRASKPGAVIAGTMFVVAIYIGPFIIAYDGLCSLFPVLPAVHLPWWPPASGADPARMLHSASAAVMVMIAGV
jgi:hypothetical protein